MGLEFNILHLMTSVATNTLLYQHDYVEKTIHIFLVMSYRCCEWYTQIIKGIMVTSCGYRKNKISQLDNETPRPPFYSFEAYHGCICYTILLLCILFINKNEKVLHDTLVINVGHLSHFLSRSFRIYVHIKLKGLLGMTPIWVFIFV